MGKRIIAQRRGKGSPTYKAKSHRFKGKAEHPKENKEMKGTVINLIHCPAHSAALMQVKYENGEESLTIAPEGLRLGTEINSGTKEIEVGNIMSLKNIPEGTLIHNVEAQPGDGGKYVRSSGTFARVVAKLHNKVVVLLPSKKERTFDKECRASVGIVSGSGRLEKPLLKAGTKYHKMRAKNKLYPRVSGTAMNAVDHPHGCSRSSRKGHPTIAPRNAPPGAKVGMIKPRRTGRKKGK